MALVTRRVLGAGRLEDRRHDVDELERRVHDAARGEPPRGQCTIERRRDAAFVDPALVVAERRVRQVRPRAPVARVGVLGARARSTARCRSAPRARRASQAAGCPCAALKLSSSTERQRLVRGAVVRQEDHERVVERARSPLERRRGCARCPGPSGRSARRTPPCAALPTPCVRRIPPRGLRRIALAQLVPPARSALGDQALHARARAARPSRRRTRRGTARCPPSRACSGQCGAVYATYRKNGRPGSRLPLLAHERLGFVGDRVGVEEPRRRAPRPRRCPRRA